MRLVFLRLLAIVFAMVLGFGILTGCEDTAEELGEILDEVSEEPEEEDGEEPEGKAEEDSDAEAEAFEDEEEEAPAEAEALPEETDSEESIDVKERSENASPLCFKGKDVNGNPVDTYEVFAKNKVTVVNCWASWCSPCVNELPELEKMNAALKEKDCGVVGFLMDGEDAYGLADGQEIIDYTGVTYLNVISPESMWDDMHIDAVPATFFVGPDGAVIGDPVVGADPNEYMKRVEQIIK